MVNSGGGGPEEVGRQQLMKVQGMGEEMQMFGHKKVTKLAAFLVSKTKYQAWAT